MAHGYKQLPLDDARPGMVLSDDVLDMRGNVLLPQGVALTEVMLDSLRRKDIATLPVLFGEVSVAELVADQAHYQARIDKLFRKHVGSEDSATASLLHYVRAFRLGETA